MYRTARSCLTRLLILASAVSILQAALQAAAPLTLVRKVIGKASARPNTALPPGTAFTTGARSKSELAIDRGIVRVGQKAGLTTSPRGLALTQGVTLVASEPGRFRKTIEVRAPGYRLKIRGTVQVAFDPGRSLKVVVLEGTATVALDSWVGEFEALRPGQMLIINPSDSRLPEPVEIDLQRLVATSGLIGGEFGELATAGNIKAGTGRQGTDFTRGELATTDILLRGMDNALEILKAAQEEPAPEPPAKDPKFVGAKDFLLTNDLDDPRGFTKGQSFIFPGEARSTTVLDNMVFERDDTSNKSRTQVLSVELAPDIAANQPPQITGDVSVSSDFLAGGSRVLKFVTLAKRDPSAPGRERLQIKPGANVHTPMGVGLNFQVNDGIDVEGATLTAGLATAASELLSITATFGGMTITNGSVLRGGRIALQGSTNRGAKIEIDHSSLIARRNLRVGIPTSHTDIVIRNSSELASIVANLDLLTNRAPITVDGGSKLTASRRLTVDSLGDSRVAQPDDLGLVTIRNAPIAADIIKVRAYAPSGDALIIDGATFNALKAGQLIMLYADGVSTLRFQNKVCLNAARAILAGKTVEVDPGGSVKISGKGDIYADQANFNTGSFGTVQAGKALTVKPFGQRPKF